MTNSRCDDKFNEKKWMETNKMPVSTVIYCASIEMGALCCCPCVDDTDEYPYSGNFIFRHCINLRFFFHQLINGNTGRFYRLEGRSVASPIQGTSPLASTAISIESSDNSVNDSHISVPRTRDGLVFRREKSITHFQDDSQLLRRNVSSSGISSLSFGRKNTGSENDSKFGFSDNLEKALGLKSVHGVAYVQPPPEDEDVCPTCLEEYTPENPKITMRCSHNFHLGCIYEWMERSESCPICGKEMEFSESL